MIAEYLFLNYIRITAVVSLYWIVSIVTVFINKTLLSSQDINLKAPFFIVWFQCFVSALICLAVKILAKCYPNIFSFPEGSPFSYKICKEVFPLSILFTCMISFNMLCLQHVGVSFYYIGRSLTTVFNVMFTYIILKEKVSAKTLICCFVIVSGFWLGVDQESLLGTLSLSGTVFGLLASLSLALYSIYTKKILPSIGNNVWLLSYYNNVYSCIILVPVMLVSNELNELLLYDKLSTPHFWNLMIISGISAFAIGYATSLQIKVTSPLTHNVSGTAKACAQTVIATYWYSETKSWLWWLSNFIVLFGSAAYTSVKQKEMKQNYINSKTLSA